MTARWPLLQISLLALLFSPLIDAAPPLPNPYCAIDRAGIMKRVGAPGQPNYFFRVFSERLWVSYAGGGNKIFDLETQALYNIPGYVDPVPMGEHIMSVPGDQNLEMYAVADILKNPSAPPILISNLDGVYQSVGLREKTAGHEIYGVIVASNPLTYQEFKVDQNASGEWQIEKHSDARTICRNVDLKLPMLSKDANEISGYDVASGTSKIWRLNHKTMGCAELEDLGLVAGKADFSYDGRKLAFHLASESFGSTDWFREPKSDANFNIHVYNRNTKKISRVSQNYPGENAYFPIYRKDGSLVYAEIDSDSHPWFIQLNPNALRAPAVDFNSLENSTKTQEVLALGKLWVTTCFNSEHLKNAETLITAALGLNPIRCEAMVKDSWEGMKLVVASALVESSRNSRVHYDSTAIGSMTTEALVARCHDLNMN